MIPEDYEGMAIWLAGRDPFYQAMRWQKKRNEEAVHCIRDKLSEEEREALELYLSASKAMEHRMGQLAAAYYALHGTTVFKAEDNG